MDDPYRDWGLWQVRYSLRGARIDHEQELSCGKSAGAVLGAAGCESVAADCLRSAWRWIIGQAIRRESDGDGEGPGVTALDAGKAAHWLHRRWWESHHLVGEWV